MTGVSELMSLDGIAGLVPVGTNNLRYDQSTGAFALRMNRIANGVAVQFPKDDDAIPRYYKAVEVQGDLNSEDLYLSLEPMTKTQIALYLGGSALAGAVIGYFLGKRRR